MTQNLTPLSSWTTKTLSCASVSSVALRNLWRHINHKTWMRSIRGSSKEYSLGKIETSTMNFTKISKHCYSDCKNKEAFKRLKISLLASSRSWALTMTNKMLAKSYRKILTFLRRLRKLFPQLNPRINFKHSLHHS